MKKVKISIYSFFAIQVLFNITLFGQVDSLPAEQVQVIKEFEAIIADVESIRHLPKIQNDEYPPLRYEYNLQVKPLDLEYPPPLIRPMAMKPDEKPNYYNGFLKLAAGTESSFFVDARYQHRVENYYNIGLDISHFSAKDKDIYNKKTSESSGELDLGYYINDKWKADLSGSFGHRRNYFYAFQDLESLPFDSTAKRDQNLMEISVAVGNEAEVNTEKSIRTGIDFYRLNFKNEDATESGLNFYIDGNAWLSKKMLLDLIFGTDFTFFERENDTYRRFYFNPAIKFSPKKWKIKLGAKLERSNDETAILPDASFQISVLGNKLHAIGGASGDYFLQNYKRQSEWNPFFNEVQDSLRFEKNINFYLGLNGQFDIVNFEFRGGYKITDNQLLYLNDPVNYRKFTPVWDNFNTIFFELAAFVNVSEFVVLEPRFIFNVFEQEFESEPWHLPSYDFSIGARIKLFDEKLNIRPQFSFSDPVKYLDFEGQPTKLNAKVDMNIEASYAIHPQFGIYFRGHNFANNEHEAFYGYKGFGIQVMGGIRARF